ncbi:hypothetical protein DVH24_032272 [Malus domestica]|uniref:Apple domain-containing protein n=1 Tax=Malus domestica TaxID=3750 RepID=A0A498J5C3_MALDO|nr:hypothetical protein DVH24_032272 [Malus domestica]
MGNTDDPKPEMFSVCVDPKFPRQLIAWKGNATYWRSSVYFGEEANTYFRNQSGGFFYIAYNFDADHIDFTSGASDNSVKLRALNLLRWIDESKTRLEEWAEPTNKCDFYARRGPYGACDKNGDPFSSQCKCLKGCRTEFKKQWAMKDWPGGCVREKALACDKGEVFSTFEKMKLPDHAIIFGNKNMSECESECLQNCSCTAYAYSKVTEKGSLGCLTWFGNLTDLVENHRFGQTMYICVHRSDQGGKGHIQQLAIAIVSAIAGSLTIIYGFFLWKKTLRNGGCVGGSMSEVVRNVSAGGGRNETELPFFSLRSILAATNNFSESNKLGEGGFGPVYKRCKIDGFVYMLNLQAWELWNEGRIREVIDESIRETCRLDEALRCIHVGFLCVQDAPTDRPTMSSIVRMLANEATSPPPINKPVFSANRNYSAVGSSSQTPKFFSNNLVTITAPRKNSCCQWQVDRLQSVNLSGCCTCFTAAACFTGLPYSIPSVCCLGTACAIVSTVGTVLFIHLVQHLRKLLRCLRFKPKETMELYCDNNSANEVAENPIQHDRKKYVKVDQHFVKENLEMKIVSIPLIDTLSRKILKGRLCLYRL